MPINKQELDKAIRAVREFGSKTDSQAVLSELAKGKSTEQIVEESKKTLEMALSGFPRFKDLKPYCFRLEKQLNYVRDIASKVFSGLKSSTHSDDVLKEAFIPGILYEEGIWVHQSSRIDSEVILLPPVLIGAGSDVSSSTIGPYSCVRGSRIEGSCVIKSVLGKFY